MKKDTTFSFRASAIDTRKFLPSEYGEAAKRGHIRGVVEEIINVESWSESGAELEAEWQATNDFPEPRYEGHFVSPLFERVRFKRRFR